MSEFPTYHSAWRYTTENVGYLSKILQSRSHAGKITHEMALKKSEQEYEKYKLEQNKIEKEQSLKEIEEDIKRINKP